MSCDFGILIALLLRPTAHRILSAYTEFSVKLWASKTRRYPFILIKADILFCPGQRYVDRNSTSKDNFLVVFEIRVLVRELIEKTIEFKYQLTVPVCALLL